MPPVIHKGRWTAEPEQELVVFLIGMHLNRPWDPRTWWWVFQAMPKMVAELEALPDSPLLAAQVGFMHRGPALTQYWRSFEELEAYARDPEALHLPAWKAFNQRVRASGAVGVWHETYRVAPGAMEAVYANMPRVGLARATTHRPVGTTSTAARRLGGDAAEDAPVEAY